MNDIVQIGAGALGSILPEIILLVGGLLIMLLDMAVSDKNESGRGFMALAVVFLLISAIGVYLQMVYVAPPDPNAAPPADLVTLVVDPFGTFMKVIIYSGMLLVALAGGSYMNQRVSGRGEFWVLFMFVTLAMSIAVSANNLLLLFLAIEFLSITSYCLVGFIREDNRSSEAGVKYFLYGSVASAVMLYGMSMLYGATGSLNLQEIAAALLASKESNPELGTVVLPIVLLLLVGLGFKTSLAPFYQWAPDVYDGAPTPITAYLSTTSKAVGFAVLVRILIVALGGYYAEWVPILAGFSIFTMSIGNLIALRQTSAKRMLAYSSVAQAGYILMGLVAVVTTSQADIKTLPMNGLNGLLIYLFAYLFTNVGAFMVIMAVEEATGTDDISGFDGLSKRSPWLAWSMFIFLLSLTGIPLTGGFFGKFLVFGAAIQHQYFWLAAIAMINAGIAAYYYLNIVRAMFFAGSGASDEKSEAMPISLSVQFSLIICVLATLWIGLYPISVIDWAANASEKLLALMG